MVLCYIDDHREGEKKGETRFHCFLYFRCSFNITITFSLNFLGVFININISILFPSNNKLFRVDVGARGRGRGRGRGRAGGRVTG